MAFAHLIVETHDRVGVITLHRPDALNALNNTLVGELAMALDRFEADDSIGAIVLTGSRRAFAAGADIGEMVGLSFVDVYVDDYLTGNWERLRRCRKPVIAAVAGYALGGGCELAMACDFIIAADSAQFGQPEIKLGVVPGAGGTQRLPLAIGKAKAMEMCLTGRLMSADEAERCGLVSRVVPDERLMEEALASAGTIASFSLPVAMMIKEAVNRAFESSLSEGLIYERRLFHAAFSLHDRREGMAAFLEKRGAKFKHR